MARIEPLPLPKDQHAELLLARLRLALARLEWISASDYLAGIQWLERSLDPELAEGRDREPEEVAV